MGKSKDILEDVGHELKSRPPKVLTGTKRKFGAVRAEKQRRAILLSKARARGASVPRKPKSMKSS